MLTEKNRILIIDDDIFTSEMYAHALSHDGYDVTVVQDGLSGYREMKSDNYDLVLLDLMLPGQMGDKILNEWRKIRPKSTRPNIIVITNYEQDEASRCALSSEADGYVIKAGTTPRRLREIIAQTINT